MQKKLSSRSSTYRPRRGSTLVMVVVMSTIAAIVTVGLLRVNLTEARINSSDILTNEARLAAEATLNHGMAQLRRRFDRSRHLAGVELEPNRATALQLEPGFLDFIRSTRAVVPANYTRPANHADFIGRSTVVGALVVNNGNARSFVIDPNTVIPEEGLPGVPTLTEIREVRVYAKATTTHPRLGERVAYTRQTFQVLDRSLFQNTVFYSGLLEIFPGANMNIGMGGGPIYGTEVRVGNTPRLHTRVETPGNFRIGRYHNSDNRNDTALLTNLMQFDGSVPANLGSAPYLVNLRTANTTGSDALQSGLDGFREMALQAYAGGLVTSEHGIAAQAAVGLEFLRELSVADAAANGELYADSNGNFDQGVYDRIGANFGHLLIAPSRPLFATSGSGLSEEEIARREALNAVEANKWSNRSGLVLEFDDTTDSVRLFHQPMSNGEPIFDAGGNRVRTEIDIATVFPDESTRFWTVERFSQPGGVNTTVEAGIYDFREGNAGDNNANGRINLIRMDMDKMRRWVEESWTVDDLTPPPDADADWVASDTMLPQFDGSWWNGGIYVAMPEVTSPPARDDMVVPADSSWAVQLYNGETLPNRFVLDPDSPRGLTLSTNSALYVQGPYNAPGGNSWDEEAYATDPGAEVPAALIADAIMLLSSAWDNARSGLRNPGTNRVAVNTPFSAALVTGNVPSTSSGQYSGGLENFPRLLEAWSGRTLTYRGSLIRLFRSESFTGEWRGGQVYSAANRNWSFHRGYRTFAPALDLGPRNYRRIHFTELTREQFEQETAQIFNQSATGS